MVKDIKSIVIQILDWNEVINQEASKQKVEIYYFSLTTCAYCRKGMKLLNAHKMNYKWIYLDELPQEKKQEIKKWVQNKYQLKSRMASPFVIFKMNNKEFISNGYDPEYWKTKFR
jgi:glutaredoxin